MSTTGRGMGETEPLMRQEPLLYTRGRHLIAQKYTTGLYSLHPQDGSIQLCCLPRGILDAVTPTLKDYTCRTIPFLLNQ